MFEQRIEELHADGYSFEKLTDNGLRCYAIRFYKHGEGSIELVFKKSSRGGFYQEGKVHITPATSVQDLIHCNLSKQYVWFITEHIDKGLRGLSNWEGWASRLHMTDMTIGNESFPISMSSFCTERYKIWIVLFDVTECPKEVVNIVMEYASPFYDFLVKEFENHIASDPF
jgi:hypothetical protein